MSHHPWMPFYVADYLADTGHLSTLEHGAYLLLIMHYWRRGGLPTNDAQLARVCHLSEAEWQEIRTTLAALFDAEWKHKRIEAELVKSEARSAAGKAGASARYSGRSAIALPSHSDRTASHSHNHKEREESNSPTFELETVLDAEHAAVVIEHRQRLRKPLTSHAAKLLGRQFARCIDPNAAADCMIERGWAGFKPEWMNERTNGAQHGKRKMADLARDFANATEPNPSPPLRLLSGERQQRGNTS